MSNEIRLGWRLLFALLVWLALPAWADDAPQRVKLGQGEPYDFTVYANAALDTQLSVERAVIVLHGVRRDAGDYYRSGLSLLGNAGLGQRDTLLMAPNFLTASDPQATDTQPLWPKNKWMHGTASSGGRVRIAAFTVLDDLLIYLADRERFPRLKEVVLFGHSAGGQLLQRYTLLGKGAQGSLRVRYFVASPSSYLYLDANRPQGEGFAPLPGGQCAGYDRYRYGLEGAPPYFTAQGLDARQVWRRYAGRDVTYLVGERDRHPGSRVMDHSCGAQAQGRDRVERQLAYLRYEAFLARQWAVPVEHRQFVLPGIGHDAGRMLADPGLVDLLFPTH